MNHISHTQLIDALQWRYATKSFDAAKKLPAELISSLIESLHLSPSSFGLQPWKFIVVENPGLREELRNHSWGQAQVTDASHFIVLAVKEKIDATDVQEWIECLAKTQSTPLEKLAPLQGMIMQFVTAMSDDQLLQWSTRQVYIALGQLMTSAAVLGVDSCPMEGMSPEGYDLTLSLKNTGYRTVVACALGYRCESDKYANAAKARFPLEQVVSVLR